VIKYIGLYNKLQRMNMEHSNKTSGSEADKSTSNADWQKKAENSEKRRRDTQSMLTPLQQENARLRAENDVLQDVTAGNTQLTLDSETVARLDDLKYRDPDAWRQEVNTLETNARKQAKTDLGKRVDEKVQVQLTEQKQAENRQVADDFFTANTDLDPSTFTKLIPVGLQDDLVAGTITAEEFFEQGAVLIRTAPVKSAKAPNSPDLGGVAGSADPSQSSKEKQNMQDWSKQFV